MSDRPKKLPIDVNRQLAARKAVTDLRRRLVVTRERFGAAGHMAQVLVDGDHYEIDSTDLSRCWRVPCQLTLNYTRLQDIEMDVGRFDQPVRVFAERRSNIADTVTTTFQAADILLHYWPGDPGARKHLAARKACIAVLEGLKDVRAARLALEAAAAEANILAPHQTFIPTSEGPKLWRTRARKLKRDP